MIVVRLRAAAIQLADDTHRLIELATVGAGAHPEDNAALADHERHVAVGLHMHLLDRRPLRERRAIVVGGEVERLTDRARSALAILQQRLERDAGHHVEVERIFGIVEALDDHAVARDEVGAAAFRHFRPRGCLGRPYHRDDARGLALGDANGDRPGELAADLGGLDPRIRREAGAGAVEIDREDILALRDAGDGRDVVGSPTLAAGGDDLAHREARARADVPARAPDDAPADAHDHRQPKGRAEDADGARVAGRLRRLRRLLRSDVAGDRRREAPRARGARPHVRRGRRRMDRPARARRARDSRRRRAHWPPPSFAAASSLAASFFALALMSPAPSAITRSPGNTSS